ncbi:MAG: hypothetical protein KDD56_10060, partial [Bdellovibrionales bacterium]|nr:hypothetical protein [Bdellovibrionales bacterium]
LHADYSELIIWAKELIKGNSFLPGKLSYIDKSSSKIILNSGSHTLHIPRLIDLPQGCERDIVTALKTVYEFTGINDFTAHPDELSQTRFSEIYNLLPDYLRISIENMDIRKKNFQSLDEIAFLFHKYKNLSFTFDICHWLELGEKLDSLKLNIFLRKFADRLKKVHFSVPKSSWGVLSEHPEIITTHHLTCFSENNLSIQFLNTITDDLTWVIEGVIPKGNFKSVLDKAVYLSQLISLDQPKDKAA